MANQRILTCVSIFGAQQLLEIPISFSESENGESSEEEEETVLLIAYKKRKMSAPARIQHYIERTVSRYTAQEFQQHFRVSIDAYSHLLRLIGPELLRQSLTGRPTTDAEKQLLAVIWLLATPDSYRSVGQRFDLAKSSLSASFVRVIKALNSLAPQVIKWPGEERLDNIKRRFHVIAGFDNVIGAVDGTFIEIKAPAEDPESYVTRKCNYAFTLQAISEPSLKFTDVFIGYPGSVSDTRIFKNSDIYGLIRTHMANYFPENEYIIGDKAYPVLSWCIPPYINRGNLTPSRVHFNQVHAKTRQVIERLFALLFGRFRRLKFLDMNRTDLIPATVLAATVLHNICLDFQDLLIHDYIRVGMDAVRHNDDEDNIALINAVAEEGRLRRDAICRQLYANQN